MNVTAIDIAILPPEPIKSLAIELSRKLNGPDFHLNSVDVLPHITLSIGFVEDLEKIKGQIAEILEGFAPFEVVVERIQGRYLYVGKSHELEKLHRQVTVQVDYVQPTDFSGAYFVKDSDDEISQGTREFTANYKSLNAFGNYIPHITFGWDDDADTSKLKAKLPQKFTASEVSICQLGRNNTCRKVLARVGLRTND